MQEKRKTRRYPIQLKLEISELFKQDNIKVEDVDAPIEVIDISKGGIGFKSISILPIGYYFNAKLELGTPENSLFCVIKIIRIDADGEKNIYGCEFVGIAPIFDYIFEEYAKSFS